MPDPALRASDDDRARVVAALERHTAAGRLSLDEFADRVSLVYAAATHGDLAGVTRDLPVEPTASATSHRQLLMAFMIAAITLVVLGVVLAVFK
jgi:hypothetical protein